MFHLARVYPDKRQWPHQQTDIQISKPTTSNHIDSNDVYHKVLGGNKHDKIESVKLTQFFRSNHFLRNDNMQVVGKMRHVKQTVTQSQVDNEPVTSTPGTEKREYSIPPKW